MRGIGPFLRDVWRLSWPYFSSEERWSAGALLGAMIGLQLVQVGATVLMSFWRNSFFNALQTKDWRGFIEILLFYRRTAEGAAPGFVAIIAVKVTAIVLFAYVTRWLQIRWRAWLTRRFQDEWLDRRAYYRMSLSGEDGIADNPDQRISDDLAGFVTSACDLTVGLLSSVATAASFVGILWTLSGPASLLGVSIPGWLVWVALLYAGAGSWLSHVVGRRLVGLRFRQQRAEADFRYALVRVRENAEAIALHRGEAREKELLGDRFARIVRNWRLLMSRNLKLDILTNGYADVAGIFPVVVSAPRYFSGAVTLGDMMQSVGAFSELQDSMSWIVNNYPRLAEWRAVTERLTTFEAAAGAPAPDGFSRGGEQAGLSRATIALPDGSPLLAGADLALRPGESVVLGGRAGSGKSTLFRALAGLWPFGGGGLRAPDGAMFLPQRAYVPLGTLRHAATYPAAPGAYPDVAVAEALTAAGLGALVPLLDEDRNWPHRLSGGEQQRLALARVLLAKPDWLFLDEATASLDPDGEAQLYRTLRERLPGTTIVSIAHRPSVAALHDRRVTLERPEAGPGRLVEDRPLAAD